MRQKIKLLVCGMLVASLVGCGGGEPKKKETETSNGSTLLIGTASYSGWPVDGNVVIKGANGLSVTVPVDSQGHFSADVAALTGPYLIRAEGMAGGSYVSLHSAATISDLGKNVNVTPLTDLMVANLGGHNASYVFDQGEFSLISRSGLDAESSKLKLKLTPLLNELNGASSDDLLKTSFNPGQSDSAMEKVLEYINVQYSSNGLSASLTTTVNNSVITDDLTKKASQELVVSQLDGNGINEADLNRDMIDSLFRSMDIYFQNELPYLEAVGTLYSDAYLNGDQNKTEVINELLSTTDNVGLNIPEKRVNSMQYLANNQAIADVSFTIKDANSIILSRENHVKLKRVNGVWNFDGDKQVLNMAAKIKNKKVFSINANQVCYYSGVDFIVNEKNTSNSSDVAWIKITGPGLPSQGIRLNRGQASKNWIMDGSVAGQALDNGFYSWANTCASSQNNQGNALTDNEIKALGARLEYQVTMYNQSGVPLTSYGDGGVYKLSTQAANPLTRTQLQQAVFPDIQNYTDLNWVFGGAFGNSTSVQLNAQNLNPKEMAVLHWGLGWSEYDVAMKSVKLKSDINGSGSVNFDFSQNMMPGGFVSGKQFYVETIFEGQSFVTEYVTGTRFADFKNASVK